MVDKSTRYDALHTLVNGLLPLNNLTSCNISDLDIHGLVQTLATELVRRGVSAKFRSCIVVSGWHPFRACVRQVHVLMM